MDEPVIGQLGRGDRKQDKAATIVVVGQLKPAEWEEFMACLKECIKRFPGKLKLQSKTYSVKIRKAKKKKPRR